MARGHVPFHLKFWGSCFHYQYLPPSASHPLVSIDEFSQGDVIRMGIPTRGSKYEGGHEASGILDYESLFLGTKKQPVLVLVSGRVRASHHFLDHLAQESPRY